MACAVPIRKRRTDHFPLYVLLREGAILRDASKDSVQQSPAMEANRPETSSCRLPGAEYTKDTSDVMIENQKEK